MLELSLASCVSPSQAQARGPAPAHRAEIIFFASLKSRDLPFPPKPAKPAPAVRHTSTATMWGHPSPVRRTATDHGHDYDHFLAGTSTSTTSTQLRAGHGQGSCCTLRAAGVPHPTGLSRSPCLFNFCSLISFFNTILNSFLISFFLS